jgi:hypothetical protein
MKLRGMFEAYPITMLLLYRRDDVLPPLRELLLLLPELEELRLDDEEPTLRELDEPTVVPEL